MRRLARRQTIYTYRKHKTGKNKSKNYITAPIPFIILSLSIVFFLFILSGYFPQVNYKSKSFISSQAMPTFQFLITQKKDTINSSSKFLLHAFLFSSMSASLAPTPKPQKFVHMPVAQAQTNAANDYCLNVPVLLYHHIKPLSLANELGHAQLTVDNNYFDMQMAYLVANNYHAISADELADALIHHSSLPAKSIVITIDDGYDDNYDFAYQILKKYNITGNFMIPSGLIDNNGYMTWSELKEMSENPRVHIYNHTFSHAYLGGETKEKIEYEITTANKQLENNLGKSIKIFTYPYGSFSPLVIDVLKEKGFLASFSTIGDTMQCESYIWTLRRIHIGNAPLTQYGL